MVKSNRALLYKASRFNFPKALYYNQFTILEEAVGFSSYREKVVEAKRWVESIISEDESISELLGRAGEIGNHRRE